MKSTETRDTGQRRPGDNRVRGDQGYQGVRETRDTSESREPVIPGS